MDDALKSLFERCFDDLPDPLAVAAGGDSSDGGAISYANPAFRHLAGDAAGLSDIPAHFPRSPLRVDPDRPCFVIVSGPAAATDGGRAAFRGISGVAQALLSASTSGLIAHHGFRPLYANRAAARLLGYDGADELTAAPTLLPHFPGDCLTKVLERHCLAMAQETPDTPAILPMMKAGGRDTCLEVGIATMATDDGPVAVLTLTDANEQMHARERELLLRDAIDNLSDSFILYDADDRVVMSNKRFHEVFPYLSPQDEIVGQSMFQQVRRSVDAGAVTDPMFTGMKDDAWIRHFIEQRHTNKFVLAEDTWPSGRWDLVKEQRLESGGFVSIRTDITDRKQAEFALKDQEARLEHALAERTKHLSAVLSNVAQGVLVLDPDLKVVLTNQGFHDLLNCPEELGAPGTHVRELIADRMKRGYMFPEELESGADRDVLVERRVASYQPLESERFRHITAGDKTIEVHREKLADGTSICTYTDITDRVRAEREVERQREALHQSEKLSALGMLLAGVAHELNNPLQVVLGNAALLETDSVNRDLSNRAGTIRDAAERCAKIVKTFLAMARDAPASKAPVDLNDLIRRAFNLIGYQLRSKDIGYKLDLSPDLPLVFGDEDQLNQVIVNLLLNAMQALEQSDTLRQIWVRTSFHDEDRVVLLEVSDTGHGVPEEVRGRIFDPFFTTKPVGLGTGIGLAVCHGMIAAHGGTITVDDAPGGGARFAVRLPEGAGRCGAATGAGARTGGAAGGRVLVIDDEPEIRELLGDILEPTGFEIETAASGREALEMIASRRYAAIVCDLRMPDLDGPGLYGEVARQVPEALSRFVFATGDLLNDAADGFLTETGRPCIAKPFLPQQVRLIVSEVAGRRGAAADRSG